MHAPAKINIGLHVLRGQKNGFHAIESIFQSVTLCDELAVSVYEGKNACVVFCETMELPKNNTIVSSYRAFRDVTGKDLPSVRVRLAKQIPSGSGLGGGSSDAAVFIRALEVLSGITLSDSELRKVAAAVGSDVFFFLFCGAEGCAVVTGRGEVVRPIHSRRDLYVLLVFPNVKSVTSEAYSLVDNFFDLGKTVICPTLTDLESVYNSPVCCWNFANSFTPSLVNRFPEIGSALNDMRSVHPLFMEMSGSGSTVYGIFSSEEEAENARAELAQRWRDCVVRPFCV